MARRWGPWTEIKLEAIEKYLSAFTKASQRASCTLYLDLFGGRPENLSRQGRLFHGSAIRAAEVHPPFTRLIVSELDPKAVGETKSALLSRVGTRATVVQGDCNVVIPRELGRLPDDFQWAATFALVDQFSAEVKWPTLKTLALFKTSRAKTKTEIMMLFGGPFMVRGLIGKGGQINAGYAARLDELYGNSKWRMILAAREDGVIDGAQTQHELVNLMRWQLEHDLSYRTTIPLTVRNTRGNRIFSMIFATDHDVGEKIMRTLFDGAENRLAEMVRDGRIDARAAKKVAEGQDALFPDIGMTSPVPGADLHEPIGAPEPPFEYHRMWGVDRELSDA